MRECYFCDEGRDFTIARKRLGDLWPFENEVVFHDENVFAIVGSAPQVIPYVLVLPYRHIYSAADMKAEEWESTVACLDYLRDRGGYGNELCIFEHGGKSENGSSSIDHCHIHVIDGKYGLFHMKAFDDFDAYYNELPDIEDSYLMVGAYNETGLTMKLSTDGANHERQYFRRRLAEIVGDEQWDWREDAQIDRMEQVMRGFVT